MIKKLNSPLIEQCDKFWVFDGMVQVKVVSVNPFFGFVIDWVKPIFNCCRWFPSQQETSFMEPKYTDLCKNLCLAQLGEMLLDCQKLYALTPNPSPKGRGEPIHPSGSLSHRERARVRAFGVLAEKLCQSIRIPTLTGISILLFVSEYLKSGRV